MPRPGQYPMEVQEHPHEYPSPLGSDHVSRRQEWNATGDSTASVPRATSDAGAHPGLSNEERSDWCGWHVARSLHRDRVLTALERALLN